VIDCLIQQNNTFGDRAGLVCAEDGYRSECLYGGEVSGQEISQVEDGKATEDVCEAEVEGMVMLISWKDCSIMPP